MNTIYFVSGVSGVGKSSTMEHLKKLLPADSYDIRDLDERGVPDGGGLVWLKQETRYWLDVAKSNALQGKDTVICGFANPELFKEVYKPEEDVSAQIILLHASEEILQKRLQGRHSTPEEIREIERTSGLPFAEFMQSTARFAPTLREICERHQCPIIETDTKSPEEVAKEIIETIEDKKNSLL